MAAGWTYCGTGALSFLSQNPREVSGTIENLQTQKGGFDWRKVSRWLFQRQTLELQENQIDVDDDEEEGVPDATGGTDAKETTSGAQKVFLPEELDSGDVQGMIPCEEDLQHAAFNGRCNKIGDTCYAFWVGGTIDVSVLTPLQLIPDLPALPL